jgi:hypothetical protein
MEKFSQADDSIEPGQSWQVDRFHPEDAEGVKELFFLVYGKGHPVKTYLQPERLIEENASGRIISSVARTSKGEIIGHCALFRSAPYDRIYESGAGAVHPSYRGGKGIFSGLGAYLQNVAAKPFGVEGIYGEAVCNHLFSQKMVAGLGWITHAVEVDLMPAEAYDKEKSASGRVTCLFDFRTLHPKPHTVYLPATYEKVLQFIYAGFDDERNFAMDEEDLSSHAATKINTEVFDFAKVARLAVHEAGKDFRNVLDEEEKSLRARGVIVIQVWLKLSWPWIGRVVNLLRKRSYFLGGILPRWFDMDALFMQKILGRPNWDGIELYTERAKKIFDFVRGDWQQVSQP